MKIFTGRFDQYTEKEWMTFIEVMYKDSDKAHDEAHIKTVWKTARKMCDFNGTRFNHIIKCAVAFHDITAKIDRKNHNMSGAEKFRQMAKGKMEDDEIDIVAKAIQEHRSSFKGEYSSIYSEILASADRENPSDVREMVERSYKYARTKEGKTPEDSVHHSVAHIKEKYGRSGTVRYPKLYKRYYKNELTRMYKKIDDITEEEYAYMVQIDKKLVGEA